MELVKYVALGLVTLLALGLTVLAYYTLGNMICEPIVRKFDMEVDNAGRTYSSLSIEEKQWIQYVDVIMGKVVLGITCSIVIIVVLLVIGFIASGVLEIMT